MYNKDFVISFVRHGESYGNVDLPDKPVFHRDDPPLTPLGFKQAQALGASDIIKGVDRVFASTLIRTVQTIYPAAEVLNKRIILLPELMEEGTVIPGSDSQLIKSEYPLAVWPENGISPAGGGLALGQEDFAAEAARAKRCIEYLYVTAKAGQHLLVATHGSFLGFLLREALGFPDRPTCRWQADNCCVTRVIFSSVETPKLSFANFTGHLSALKKHGL